jgi:hypothetical protein
MRNASVRSLVLLVVIITACVPTPEGRPPIGEPSTTAAIARLAVAPPVFTPDGKLRFVTTVSNEVRAEDPATGAVRWTLPTHPLAVGSSMHWRLLVSNDGSSLYVQSVADGRSPTYLGTRRIDARTGVELANDAKSETYWYENVVLWMALTHNGTLQMAVERAPTAGGGYRLRTLDPLTLKMLSDIPTVAPPATPRS